MASFEREIGGGSAPGWLMPETLPVSAGHTRSFSDSSTATSATTPSALSPRPRPPADLARNREHNAAFRAARALQSTATGLSKAERDTIVQELVAMCRDPKTSMETHRAVRDGLSFDPNAATAQGALRSPPGEPRVLRNAHQAAVSSRLGHSAGKDMITDLVTLAKLTRSRMPPASSSSGGGGAQPVVVVISNGYSGGGVAEMFRTMGAVLDSVDVKLEWHALSLLTTDPVFLEGPRKVFDAIQGQDSRLTESEKRVWLSVTDVAATILGSVVTDPQVVAVFFEDHHTAPLIRRFVEVRTEHRDARTMTSNTTTTTSAMTERTGNTRHTETPRFVWRCHLDTTGIEQGRAAGVAAWRFVASFLEHLDDNDVVFFQPGSVPPDALARLPGKKIFAQPPGVDLLNEKNVPISNDELLRSMLAQVVAEQNVKAGLGKSRSASTAKGEGDDVAAAAAVAPPLALDTPFIVTGGRLVPWKGIFATIAAFASVKDVDPTVHLLVVVAVGLDDPRKRKGYDLALALTQQLGVAHRVRFIVNESSRLCALYTLAARHQLPTVFFSYAEGWNLMVDEAALHGAVSVTSDAGGLQRNAAIPFVRQYNVPLRDLMSGHQQVADDGGCERSTVEAADIRPTTQVDPVNFFQFATPAGDDASSAPFVVESVESQAFTSRLSDALGRLLRMRRDHTAEYAAWYTRAAAMARRAAVNASLLPMTLNYLAVANASPKHLAVAFCRPEKAREVPLAAAVRSAVLWRPEPARVAAELPDALEAWNGILRRLDGKLPMLFIDFDGTLTTIQDTPAAATLPTDTLVTLERAAKLFPVAIVTGRGMADIKEKCSELRGVTFAASHGFDVETPGYQRLVESDLRDELKRMHAELCSQIAIAGNEDVLVEFKSSSIAVHYRRCPERKDELVATTTAVANDSILCHRFRVVHDAASNGMVVEIVSALPWNKGSVIRMLHEEDLTASFVPIFVGDALTDENAFESLHRGVGVWVRNPFNASANPEVVQRRLATTKTAAQFTIADPRAVRELVERLMTLAQSPSHLTKVDAAASDDDVET